MPNLVRTSWGATPGVLGDAGGVVTWSIAGAGQDVREFTGRGSSVDPDSFLTIDYQAVFSDAFAQWSSFGNIEFLQVEDTGGAAGVNGDIDIRIFFTPALGGSQGFGFFPTFAPSAIAGDIALSANSAFNSRSFFFSGLVLHEIGHALGLDHVFGQNALNPQIVVNTLQADDILGIEQIYGQQDGAAAVYDLPTGVDELTILESPLELTINGNNLDNLIVASGDAETINGAEGNDTLVGGGGADALDGGDGIDVASYSTATSRIKIDLIRNATNAGDAIGDTFTDIERFIGSHFDDLFLGDTGRNYFEGQAGDDDIRGRAGRDTLLGGEGDDVLNGGKGRDRLLGGQDDDLLLGLRGLDNLQGGQGNDTLVGGEHNDRLSGGQGNDVFVFADGDGHDILTGFEALNDNETLDFSAVSALNEVLDVIGPGGAASQVNDDVLIDTGGGNSVLLVGVVLGDLGVDDFIF